MTISNRNKNSSEKKRYFRKRVDFFKLLQKMKLWPSRNRVLHGIKTMEIIGRQAWIATHCNETFLINNSKNSRAARHLRNKWDYQPCNVCQVPLWKLDKYNESRFSQSYGTDLADMANK